MKKTILKRWLKLFKEYEAPVSTALGFLVVLATGIIITLIVVQFRNRSREVIVPEQVTEASPTPTPTALPVFTTLPESIYVYQRDGQYYVEDLPVQYQVQPGDSLASIALAFYKSTDNSEDIAAVNNLAANPELEVGQQLLIPDVPTRLSVEIIESEKEDE